MSIHVADLANGALPQDDGVELKPDEINALVNEAAENFAYADMPQGGAEVTGSSLAAGGLSAPTAALAPRRSPRTSP